jgi:hypothetical protein
MYVWMLRYVRYDEAFQRHLAEVGPRFDQRDDKSVKNKNNERPKSSKTRKSARNPKPKEEMPKQNLQTKQELNTYDENKAPLVKVLKDELDIKPTLVCSQ